MKKIFFFLIILFYNDINCQNKKTDFFFIDNKKYLKPIKYIEYNSKIDRKKITNNDIYFYIKGERFKFSKSNHKLDTCNINSLCKYKIEKIEKLSNNEYIFYKRKINKVENRKEKMLGPMPINRLHAFFKIIILEKYQRKILKFEVDWENSHSY